MLIRFFVLNAVLSTAAFAQQTPAPQHGGKDRTLGYDDTPFLPGGKWRVHDVNRPRPEVITPGVGTAPPSDAIVLFDGKDLSNWVTHLKGQDIEPKWIVRDGYAECVDGAGGLSTRQSFGDIQLHIEWATPAKVEHKSQDRGNSGILFMDGRYEVQVLDSYENPTYADGQAAALYGQFPPPVNASRKPGEWQTYDIVFEAPKFDGDKLVKPAFVTVFQNNVLMHNRQELLGDTPHAKLGTYKPHAAELPLQLQNHHTSVRYRNIWVRKLNGAEHVDVEH